MTARYGVNGGVSGTSVASLTLNFTVIPYAGDTIISCGGIGGGRTVTGVSDNMTGNTHNQICAPTVQNATRAYMYAAYNINATGTGTYTLTWTLSGSGAGAMVAGAFSNVVTSAAADPATTTGGGVTAGTSASATVAQTTNDNVQIMAAFSATASLAFTNTSPTVRNVSGTNTAMAFSPLDTLTAGATLVVWHRNASGIADDSPVASTWTASATSSASTDFVIVAGSFKTISGGSLVWSFHADTPTANSPPATPANCATISQVAVDLADNVSPSNSGGHTGASGTLPQLVLCKPTVKDNLAQVTGSTPPSAVPPIAAHQFGWWSDIRLQGYIPSGTRIALTAREDDTVSGLTGNPILNFYACSTRDFTGTFRYLGSSAGTPDWWTGATTNSAGAAATAAIWVLQNEYLFVQIWCNETAGASAGATHTFHQEGTNLGNPYWYSRIQFQFISSIIPLARKWFNAPQSMRQLLAR